VVAAVLLSTSASAPICCPRIPSPSLECVALDFFGVRWCFCLAALAVAVAVAVDVAGVGAVVVGVAAVAVAAVVVGGTQNIRMRAGALANI